LEGEFSAGTHGGKFYWRIDSPDCGDPEKPSGKRKATIPLWRPSFSLANLPVREKKGASGKGEREALRTKGKSGHSCQRSSESFRELFHFFYKKEAIPYLQRRVRSLMHSGGPPIRENAARESPAS